MERRQKEKAIREASMNVSELITQNAEALMGRNPKDLADDYATTDDCMGNILMAETRLMEKYLSKRLESRTASKARNIAIELLPAIATTAQNEDDLELMIDEVIEWIEDMGNVKRYMERIVEERVKGYYRKTSLVLNLNCECDAVFDIQDKESLSASVIVYQGVGEQEDFRYISNTPVIVGMYFIDRNDDDRTNPRIPELTA
jgi:hypothetical protein